ncbi:MAG: hypothetical protein ACREJC_22920, partial [Tepidisphaeraceae bacterium]
LVVIAMTPALELEYYDAEFGLGDANESTTQPAQQRAGFVGRMRTRVREWIATPDDPARGRRGRLFVPGVPDLAVVRMILGRERATGFLLLRNDHWPGQTDRLIELIQADPAFEMQEAYDAGGVRFLRVRSANNPATTTPSAGGSGR